MTRHSKTRSGCRVCKRKRLKCDETKPSCLNCVRRNIACPGYQQALRWSTKHQLGVGTSGAGTKSRQPTTSTNSGSFRVAHTSCLQPTVLGNASLLGFADSTSDDNLYFDDWSVSSPYEPWVLDHDSMTVISGSPVSSMSTTSSISTSDGSDSVGSPLPGDDFVSQRQLILPQTDSDTDALSLPSIASTSDTQLWTSFAEANGSATLTSTNSQLDSVVRPVGAPSEHCPSFLSVPAPLLDPSTMLIEFWFHSVCSGWAAYDSPSNPFRQLCASLWSSSAAVYYSMQTMAAASTHQQHHKPYWPSHWPSRIQKVVAEAPQLSMQALIHDIDAVFQPHIANRPSMANGQISLPAGLLVSLFCMSSSLSWIDSHELGMHYIKQARIILDYFDQKNQYLSAHDRRLLDFFKGCLIYEKMLRSLVSEDVDDFFTGADNLEPASEPERHTGIANLEGPPAPPAPAHTKLALHAWAGVPNMITWLFGKVMVLCRQSRTLWLNSGRADFNFMHTAMAHIQEAQKLEEKLLAIDVWVLLDKEEHEDYRKHTSHESLGNFGTACLSLGSRIPEHRPSTSPHTSNTAGAAKDHQAETRQHLVLAAEAYRLCALLHLHQTFPDLVARRLPQHVCPSIGTVPDDAWVQPLALHIISILQKIPASSGMRCLQPLLCICAGSALRPTEGLSSTLVDTASFGVTKGNSDDENLIQHRATSLSSTTDGLNEGVQQITSGHLAPAIPLAAAYYWEGFLPPSPSNPFNIGIWDNHGSTEARYLQDFEARPAVIQDQIASTSLTAESLPGNLALKDVSHIDHVTMSQDAHSNFPHTFPILDPAFNATSRDTINCKVREARAFLRQRIHDLQQLLPPKPIIVAGELLEEIWSTMDARENRSMPQKYSDSSSGAHPSGRAGGLHWLDLVGTGRFQSVFG